MPPKKVPASDSADASAPTRRSARISTQSKSETTLTATKRRTTTTKNNKKRSAEAVPVEGGADAESSTNKKAKPSSETQEPQADEMQVETVEDAEQAEAQMEETVQPIDVGGILPTLTLKNEQDEDVQVANLAAQRGVVMFLVPKADTPGCTTQACGFRDTYASFTEAGYDVYCLSADTPAAQTKWQTKKELPYHLLSDRNRILIGALGAGEGGKTKRSHFIFEKGGKLVEKVMPVKPIDSPKLALEFIKSNESSDML